MHFLPFLGKPLVRCTRPLSPPGVDRFKADPLLARVGAEELLQKSPSWRRARVCRELARYAAAADSRPSVIAEQQIAILSMVSTLRGVRHWGDYFLTHRSPADPSWTRAHTMTLLRTQFPVPEHTAILEVLDLCEGFAWRALIDAAGVDTRRRNRYARLASEYACSLCANPLDRM